ncbi:hypothetical protein GCM10010170_042230 [Dactylosporangium salmoneum]|uniref:Uncharacterized protein n=1 Tax=Dactylosporangium salmoneum TaxID=53361 RepID=A0ABN3GID5_9ACTN
MRRCVSIEGDDFGRSMPAPQKAGWEVRYQHATNHDAGFLEGRRRHTPTQQLNIMITAMTAAGQGGPAIVSRTFPQGSEAEYWRRECPPTWISRGNGFEPESTWDSQIRPATANLTSYTRRPG